MSLSPPATVAPHLICGIEAGTFDQTFCQAKGHGCVVCPLARLQPEWTATYHIGERRKATRLGKFDRRPNGIANGQSEEATEGALHTG